jgi:hypothetical protein
LFGKAVHIATVLFVVVKTVCICVAVAAAAAAAAAATVVVVHVRKLWHADGIVTPQSESVSSFRSAKHKPVNFGFNVG